MSIGGRTLLVTGVGDKMLRSIPGACPVTEFRQEQEAIYMAMVLGRQVVEELARKASADAEHRLVEVRNAIQQVITLLERDVDPKQLAVLEP